MISSPVTDAEEMIRDIDPGSSRGRIVTVEAARLARAVRSGRP